MFTASDAGFISGPRFIVVTIVHPTVVSKLSKLCRCLKLIQEAMKGDKADEVKKIYETVGTYLGYALAGYCEFYKIDHVMILGLVSKGKGGDIMLDQAKKVGTAAGSMEQLPTCLFDSMFCF